MRLLSTILTTALPVIFLLNVTSSTAQNTRITDRNTIGWYAYTGTIGLKGKWSVHTEAQWRRNEVITEPMQLLLRAGVNYKVSDALSLQAGYGYITTYAYGDFPLNAFGKTFPEHRTFQTATVSDHIGRIDLTHRFRLEQRWVGKFASAASDDVDSWVYTNRFRYMLRLQCPLQGKTLDDHEWYAAAADEILLGFGKNVGENVFDQNRMYLLLGYRFSKSVRLEAGYMEQIVQLGREVNNRNVFQYNSGLNVSGIFNINAFK